MCVSVPSFVGVHQRKGGKCFQPFVFLKMDFLHSHLTETLARYKILGWKWLSSRVTAFIFQNPILLENLMSFCINFHSFEVNSTSPTPQSLSLEIVRTFSLTPVSFVMQCLPVGLVFFGFLAICWVGPFNLDTHVLQFSHTKGRKERFHQENL